MSMFSFTASKKTINVQGYIRKICDCTTPNNTHSPNITRTENRYNRTIPVVLCPWINDKPVMEHASIVLTKDMCDRGVGIILQRPLNDDEVAIGFNIGEPSMQEPWFFRAKVQRNYAIGGGFWLAGLELEELLNDVYRHELGPIWPWAEKLVPPQLANA